MVTEHCTPIRMADIKRMGHAKSLRGCGQWELSEAAGGQEKWYIHFGKQLGSFSTYQTHACLRIQPFHSNRNESTCCICQVLVTVTKYLRVTTESRKNLFWFMVSEVVVHSQLDPLLLGPWQRVWWKKLLTP
jgi:hypothetical protein